MRWYAAASALVLVLSRALGACSSSDAASPDSAAVSASPATTSPTLGAGDFGSANSPTAGGDAGGVSRPASTPAKLATDLTLEAPFDGTYKAYDLGEIPGVPSGHRYGGAMLAPNDKDSLLFGVDSEAADGSIWRVKLTRGWDGNIIGFSGTASRVMSAPNVDANLLLLPDGSMLVPGWPTRELHVIAKGGTAPAHTYTLPQQLSGLGFVPGNFPAGIAGRLKMIDWSACNFHTVDLAVGASGLYEPGNVHDEGVHLPNGCGGFAYIPNGSPLFPKGGLMLAEWSTKTATFEIDANANPIPSTRREFLSNLAGSWSAYFDTVSGNYLFLTWGNSPDRVIVVQGFVPPPPTPPPPSTPR